MSTEIIELSKDEVAERSQTLAAKIYEQIELDLEKKESAKNYSEKMKNLSQEIFDLSNTVRSGKEYRRAKGLFEQDFEGAELS